MTLLAVAATVSMALVLGALWALYGRLGDRTEGFVLAAGGGALMFSAVLELIVPAQEFISLTATGVALMIGAGLSPSSTISSTSVGAMRAASAFWPRPPWTACRRISHWEWL